jgi:hypothetical protein
MARTLFPGEIGYFFFYVDYLITMSIRAGMINACGAVGEKEIGGG